MFGEYMEFVKKNKHLRPEFQYITLSEKQNSFQYVGGQIFNGKLYAIVNSAEKMLGYDISAKEMNFYGSFDKSDFKWTGGCIYKKKLYSFPRSAKCLLIYNIRKGIFEKGYSMFAYRGEHHYGGVCTKSGIIYQPPRNTDHILKWNIEKKTCEKLYIKKGTNMRYCGSVLHPDGYIYFMPEKDYPVIKMSVETQRIEYIGIIREAMVFNPVIAADGNIYGFRMNGKGILKIDTKTNEVSVLHGDTSILAYGAKVGINGNIYSIPGNDANVWEFNPFSGELKKIYSVDAIQGVHYAGGATDLNGDIYAIPVHEGKLLKITFGADKISIPENLYDCFFYDFY